MDWFNPAPLSKAECAALRKRIYDKNDELREELAKYDPVGDGQGGWPMKWGSGLTKPGGHYTEILNLQRGLNRDLEIYNRRCKCGNDDDSMPSLTRNVDALANTPVPLPVIPIPFDGLPPMEPFSPVVGRIPVPVFP